MAKQAVALRLEPELLAWVDAYAKGRKVSRQVVLETAVEAFRSDCEGGVPDFTAVEAPVAARSKASDAPSYASVLGMRQRALNEAKARSSR